MTSGSPLVPFVIRKMRGNPGKRAMRKPVEPSLLPQPPEPPAYLTTYAKEEWHRVAGELHQIGLLSSVDIACLAVYCSTYGLWRSASEQLQAEGLVNETIDGKQSRHPLIGVVADAASDMVRFAGEFGLTPVARTRIANGIHQPQPPSKFDGLLAGHED